MSPSNVTFFLGGEVVGMTGGTGGAGGKGGLGGSGGSSGGMLSSGGNIVLSGVVRLRLILLDLLNP